MTLKTKQEHDEPYFIHSSIPMRNRYFCVALLVSSFRFPLFLVVLFIFLSVILYHAD